MSKIKYTDEMIAHMKEVVAGGVTEDAITSLVTEFDSTRRSVAAKLRSLGFDVPSKSDAAPKFSAEETEAFKAYLSSNEGQFTAEEIAANFAGGKFDAKQVRGKALAVEMTGAIKKAEKKSAPKTYTAEEEAKVGSMADSGAFIEDIAAAVGKPVNSVRGKLLSMDKKAPQKVKKENSKNDSYPGLEHLAPTMTVEELQVHYSKDGKERTSRGVKTALTRRKVSAKDYDVSKKVAA